MGHVYVEIIEGEKMNKLKKLWENWWGLFAVAAIVVGIWGVDTIINSLEAETGQYDRLAGMLDEEARPEIAEAMKDGKLSVGEFRHITDNINNRNELRAIEKARQGLKR